MMNVALVLLFVAVCAYLMRGEFDLWLVLQREKLRLRKIRAEGRATRLAVTQHYAEVYNHYVCPELAFAIRLLPDQDDGRLWTVWRAIAEVEWIFFCEWDADVAYWYDDDRINTP